MDARETLRVAVTRTWLGVMLTLSVGSTEWRPLLPP